MNNQKKSDIPPKGSPIQNRPINSTRGSVQPPQKNVVPQINKNPKSSEGVYDSGKNIKFLEPEIVEKKNWELKHAGFALGLGFALILIQFVAMIAFDLTPVGSWILAFILIVIFGIAVYFLMEPRIEKEIRQKIIETNIQTIDRPVVKEVVKTVEVERPVEVVKEVPVLKEVPVYQPQKTVYVVKNEPKPVVKRAPPVRYNFVGSKIQMIYHKSSCRLGKSIKRKYLVRSLNSSFFKRLGYKPCKACNPDK